MLDTCQLMKMINSLYSSRPTLLLANTATNLAVQLIASSSKGRGFVLPSELGYVESIKQDDGVRNASS